MNAITSICSATPWARDQAAGLGEFFAHHGRELREILEAVGKTQAAQAADELITIQQRPSCAINSEPLLQEVLEGLATTTTAALDSAARKGAGPADLHAAFLWYGARVAEFTR